MLRPPVCSYGLPKSTRAGLIIDVLPQNGVAIDLAAAARPINGHPQEIRYSWGWHYVFAGLTITN